VYGFGHNHHRCFRMRRRVEIAGQVAPDPASLGNGWGRVTS
jgi:hypothetical protein